MYYKLLTKYYVSLKCFFPYKLGVFVKIEAGGEWFSTLQRTGRYDRLPLTPLASHGNS